MATTSNHFIVILCGGTGPRLWPLSRANQPKQFLRILNPKTLLEQTFYRSKKIVPSKNIFIVSNQRYQEKIEKLLNKQLPPENFIYEPGKKNTATAILLAISYIQKINPQAVITTTPSDHFIPKIISFKKTILRAAALACGHHQILTIGIKPTFPNTSYGYIVPQIKNQNFSHVSLFTEKPDKETAQNLIKKGAFWNSGIYTFTINDMLSEFEKLQPEYFTLYQQFLTAISNPKKLSSIYDKSPELPIDRAISEKSDKMSVIPAKFDWSDVGEWRAIKAKSPQDKDGHSIIDQQTEYLSYNSKNCLINGTKGKIVTLVGVENLAVIDTPDGLLVCPLDQSHHVRDLVGLMVKNKKYKNYFLKN
ncbi:MAG: sugar phosphate nucleotidyltransferase [Candidatus Shapirobacteria bacterium]|nr:sugar phosphate nucleotidyltransferase [Candidatus Shapirobacteria bacterium]